MVAKLCRFGDGHFTVRVKGPVTGGWADEDRCVIFHAEDFRAHVHLAYVDEAPRPQLEAVRIVDMSASNSWAEFAATFRRTRPAYQEHEGAKADLKKLVPEDAREAVGHGLRAKRSKSGAISFDLLDVEAGHAALQ